MEIIRKSERKKKKKKKKPLDVRHPFLRATAPGAVRKECIQQGP
jgi:hypothetical protein